MELQVIERDWVLEGVRGHFIRVGSTVLVGTRKTYTNSSTYEDRIHMRRGPGRRVRDATVDVGGTVNFPLGVGTVTTEWIP